jgi:predicted phosphodiesterase
MRIAIIADIHEDIAILEKAYKVLQSKGYDVLVCLGDITGYAREFYDHKPDANACIDLIKDKADIVIAGNHDLFNSQRLPSYFREKNIPENWYNLSAIERKELANNSLWLYEEEVIPTLSSQNMQFLKELKEHVVYDTGDYHILFSHFLKPDLSGISKWFPYRIRELKQHFEFMEEGGAKLAFVGHSHPNGVTLAGKLFWSAPRFEPFSIKNNHRIIFCPPLAGGRKSGSFIMFDSSSFEITPLYIG